MKRKSLVMLLAAAMMANVVMAKGHPESSKSNVVAQQSAKVRGVNKSVRSSAAASGTSRHHRAALMPSFFTFRNIVYAMVDGAALLMDIDVPRNQGPGPFPALLDVHGGGYYLGGRTATPHYREALRGYAVVRIEYRLSGTWKFPAQIYDLKGAVRFIRRQAANYHINPDKIGVIGTSAGGHLAALLGTTGDSAPHEGSVGGNLQYSSRVQAVVDISGPSDFTILNDNYPAFCLQRDFTSPNGFYSRLFSTGMSFTQFPELVQLASPAAFATPDDPPFILMHGDADCLVPYNQSTSLLDALIAQGVEATLITMAGKGHGLVLYQYPAARDQVEAFLDQHLK